MRKLTIFLALQFIWLIAPAQEQWFSNDAITGLDPPAGFAARNHAVSFVIGDTAYIGTGDSGSATLTDFWKYVPATKEWTQIADFPGHRRQQAVAFVLDGKGYVGTGRSGTTLFDDFYRYDPVTNSWDTVANFGGGDRRNAVAFVVDGEAYVGTGYNTPNPFSSNNVNVTNDLWQYDPTTNQWIEKNNKVPRARGDATAFSMGGKGYIVGGIGTATKNIYEYDPTTDSYQIGFPNDFMYDRNDGVAFVLDDKAYIGLGNKHPAYQTTDFFIFKSITQSIVSPSQNTNENEDNFGDPTENNRWGAIAFVVRGKAFVGLGGYTDNGTTRKEDLWSFQSPVPDAPENLTVTTPTQTSVMLRWTSHANNETGYNIERSEGDSENFTVAGVEGVDSTLYERNGLPVDKEYFYRVQAKGSPNSAYSDTVVVNTYNPPSDLTANVVSATEITLSWEDNSTGEQGFIIQRATNGPFSELATVSADIKTYTDATAQPGIDYTYRVLAQATKSNSAPSNAVTAGSLTNPTNLTADATGRSFVQLNWSYSGDNAGRFVIERRNTDGSEFMVIANITATTSPQYQDKTVGEASSYEYRVKAEDLPRTSTYSDAVSVITQLLDPTAVLATVQDSTVAINWNDVSTRETHYAIQRSLADGSESVVLDTLAADVSNFVDTTSLSAGDYHYIVQALGTSVNSNAVVSNAITVVEPPKETEAPGEGEPTDEEPDPEEEEVVTATQEVVNPDKVKVYPNPSEGMVEINVGSERFAYLAVFNSQGRLVEEVQQAEQGSSATVQLDLQFLSVGVYTLRVYTSQGIFVKKLAIQ